MREMESEGPMFMSLVKQPQFQAILLCPIFLWKKICTQWEFIMLYVNIML